METDALALAQQIDFSIVALFARATFTVKVVMIILILASFWAWAVILQKTFSFRRARGEAKRFDKAFWSGEPLDLLFDKIGPEPKGRAAGIFAAGMMEWQSRGKAKTFSAGCRSWPRSARPRRSSGCLGPSGAS